MYLSAVSSGWRSEPPMFEQEVQRRLEREQRDDRAAARTGTIDANTNGTAYFFSLGFRPGVMKRHSCQSHTGSASTMPP